MKLLFLAAALLFASAADAMPRPRAEHHGLHRHKMKSGRTVWHFYAANHK